jgi:hypothetical protein
MIIDGTDVSTLGVIAERRPQARSAPSITQVLDAAPGAWRRVRLGKDAPEAKVINVTGAVVGDTLAQLRSRIDQFKWMVRPDTELAVRFSDYTDREWLGYRTSLGIADIDPGWVTNGVKFDLQIICPDPFARELSLQNKQTSGAAPLVLTPDIATAPMPVIITITGNTGANLVNPVLHYRDKNNTDIITLALADTLDGTETVVLDTEHFTAVKNGSTNVGGLISGSYFDVNPKDGDYLGSPAGPDIQLTADSGTADLFKVEYYRRYW